MKGQRRIAILAKIDYNSKDKKQRGETLCLTN